MKQSATLKASTTDCTVHFPPISSSRTNNKYLTLQRFRLFPFLLVIFFSVTTGLSTTFPLKAGNNHRHINRNGLPLKSSGPLVTNQVNEETKEHVPIATSVVRSSDTADSVKAPTSEEPKLEGEEDDTTQTNDTDDEKETEKEKEKEKMNVPDDQKFKERIQSSIRTVQNWETVEWLKACRETIPWDDLRNATGPYSRPEQDRLLADDSNALFLQRLCRWFPKFMTWVNAPPCVKCGCKECEMKTVRGPENEEENEGNAKRVEVYYCPECKENTTTFPRYNKARKLLETRKGRCGEYSNLFGMFCRAVGFETRLVLDLSDHLWTEVRIGDNWIMADSCEGVIDKPSMYEYGWGKDGLSYMIAIASDHVVDVTPRYTRKFLSEEFQNRRRSHTTSEHVTARVLEELNRDLQRNLTQKAIEELSERLGLEEAELQLCKQATEWTPQEKYGRGRISGSLAWKQSRQEDGKTLSKNEQQSNEKALQVPAFEIEPFLPPISNKLSLQVRPKPSGRHDGIIVAGTACAVGEADSISVVVVDETCLGCILQSQSFLTWTDANDFVNRLPSERIVLINGKCGEDSKVKSFQMERLGGWIRDDVVKEGVAFIGQVDAQPDWVYCSTLENCPLEGYEVILQASPSHPSLKLLTDRHTMPSQIAGRLPETVMPLKTQVLASEEQKKIAISSFFSSSSTRFAAYTTKAGSPVYFLDSASYPLVRLDAHTLQATTNGNTWSTFRFLPEPLVTEDDNKAMANAGAKLPSYDVPLETNFFGTTLGTQLLCNNTTRLPTSVALHNARLVGLYFSAHWCGPCRSFTPMLAEMYVHLKEHRPSHGLEIVFVSSDRDANSFLQYFGTMPWQAVPFDQIQLIKNALNMTYGIRGIPSLVVLDTVTGRVVVPANESRQAVGMACRGGEQQIEALLDSWLDRVPIESKEILSMLELSCQDDDLNQTMKDDKENPYLLTAPKSSPPLDAAARIKDFFEKLVAEGNDPTSAAAKAIGLVADEQKSGRKFNPGPLDGKAIRKGTIVVRASGLDETVARVIENNSLPAVRNAFNILMKYLANASSEPWSPKFRTFKLSNKVADQVVCLEGGLTLIRGLGFEIHGTSQDFKATVPVSMDLEATTQKLTGLIKELDEKHSNSPPT